MTITEKWLLFLPQLPGRPSSLRVMVWRRLRSAGAVGLQNGVWALPHRQEQERFLTNLLLEIEPQRGTGLLLTAETQSLEHHAQIVERFRHDRDQDYAEFCERCDDFLGEVAKETGQQKFTYAELEENEVDLQKLQGWLGRIQARDFFGGHRREEASAALARCRDTLRDFAHTVYEREGLEPHDDDGPGDPGPVHPPETEGTPGQKD